MFPGLRMGWQDQECQLMSKRMSSHSKILPERFLNELQRPLTEHTKKTFFFFLIFRTIWKPQDQVQLNADTLEHSGLRSTKTPVPAKNSCLLSYLWPPQGPVTPTRRKPERQTDIQFVRSFSTTDSVRLSMSLGCILLHCSIRSRVSTSRMLVR